MRANGKVDYVEFPGVDLVETKRFYNQAFGWTFSDYGEGYSSFRGQGVNGGFQADPDHAPSAPLVVIYTDDIEGMLTRVIEAGGEVTRPIFDYPGGRRFSFRDPSGNELAVWSEYRDATPPEPPPPDPPEPRPIALRFGALSRAWRDFRGRQESGGRVA